MRYSLYTCDKCKKPYRVIYQPVGSAGPIDPLDHYIDLNDPRFCHCRFSSGYGTTEIYDTNTHKE